MEEDTNKKTSVEKSVQDLLDDRNKHFSRANHKTGRWLPLWLTAILFTYGTFMGTAGTRPKGSSIRGARVVVWLRRFNISCLQAFNFHRALNQACRGFGIPITVQGGSIRFSWHKFAVEFLKERILSWLFAYFLFCFVAIWLLPGNWAFPVAMSIWASIVGIMMRRAYLRAFLVMDVGTARNQLMDLISTIQKKEELHDGVSVVRCGTAFWRSVVRIALSNADIALVDVTDITENLKWELEQSTRRLKPEAIILTYAHSGGLGRKLPQSTHKAVSAVIGENAISRCQVFTYPVSYGIFGILNFRLFQKVQRKLTKIIVTAIVAAAPQPIER